MLQSLKVLLKAGCLGACGASCVPGAAMLLDVTDVIDLTDYPIARAARTGITTASIMLDYKTSLHSLRVDSPEYMDAKSQVHTRSAHKLLNLCWRNRGTYVKVGQHLGGMDYLLPVEYTKVLKILHSNAPQSPLQDIHQVIKEELDVESIDEVFSRFWNEPLGTASLSQVHKAILKHDNSIVAVKVQHPKLRDHAGKDMRMMEFALSKVKEFFPEFNLMWLAEETRNNLPIELDFRNEAQNCEMAKQNLKSFNWVKLPQIHWDFSTSRVMVMEYLEGGEVNDQAYCEKHQIEFSHVASLLGKLFSEMIFVHGFVHCDPHPGNILIRWKENKMDQDGTLWSNLRTRIFGRSKKLEIVLLDHGLYKQLTKDFRFNYSSLWQAIINTDLVGIEHYSRMLGSEDMFPLLATIVTGRAWHVVGEQGVKNVGFSESEDNDMRDNVGNFLPYISQILARVPREMLLVLKTNDHLRGLEHFYGIRGEASGFLDMSRCCLRALHDLRRERLNHDCMWLSKHLQSIKLTLQLQFDLLKISLYQLYLWISEVKQESVYQSVSSRNRTMSQELQT